MTMLPAGKAYTTAELKINIVRPLTDKVPLVRAEGTRRSTPAAGWRPPKAGSPAPTASCTLTPPPPASSSTCMTSHRADMRFLHTMLRVGDLQRSIDFYTQVMGMKLLRTTERPEQKYSLAFVGYGAQSRSRPRSSSPTTTASTDYELGTRLRPHRHRRRRRQAACDRIRAGGGAVTREAGPVKGGTTVIAFVTDPDGYKIELIERDAA